MKFSALIGSMVKTLIICFICNSLSVAQVTIVKGKLLDVNKNPSNFAFVGTLPENSQFENYAVKCDKNGAYSIKLTTPGMNNLMYSIPGHSALIIPVNNNKNKEFSIDVTLSAYKYKDNFDDVGVMGNFNNYNLRSPNKMEKLGNGTYKLEIKTDLKELWYQLCGIEMYGRTVNPPECNDYRPDSTGDYYTTMPVKDGKAVITFDPSKLLRSDKTYQVTFKGSKYDEQLYRIYSDYTEVMKDASMKINEFYNINKNTGEYHYEKGNYFIDFPNKIDSEKNKELKSYLKLIYIMFSALNPTGYNFEKAASFYSSLKPSDPVWDMLPQAFFSYNSLFPQHKWNEITDNFLKYSKSKNLKLSILKQKLMNAKFAGKEEEFKEAYAAIIKDFGNDREAIEFLKNIPLETKIKVGAEIPDFEVASIDSPYVVFSKQNMLGKIYLIDFWATWCSPCVNEMESLHKAFEKYKDKGFEIISLSRDGNVETIFKFRKDKWPMPWKNGFLGDENGSKIADKFEVLGIPRPILVDAEGKILAMEMDLRGANLEATLEKYFNK